MSEADIPKVGRIYSPIALGEKLYVWTDKPNPPNGERCAVISAHGGKRANPVGRRPWPMIVFYGPDGTNLLAGPIGRMAAGKAKFYEHYNVDSVPLDYDLSKFQGKHGDPDAAQPVKEDYEKIAITMHAATIRAQNALVANPLFHQPVYDIVMDVITLRHRWFSSSPTLWQVCAVLQDYGYKYRQIHCSFCRGGDPKDDLRITTRTTTPKRTI